MVVKSVLVHSEIPSWLLATVKHPELSGEQYKHLVDLAIKYESALNQCNVQLKKISEQNTEK